MLSQFRKSLEDLLDDTYLRLQDTERERFPLSDVIQAINEATLWLALDAEMIVKSVPVKLLQYEAVYDLAVINAVYGSKTHDYGYFVRAEYVDDDDAVLANPPGRYDPVHPLQQERLDWLNVDFSRANRPEWIQKNLLSPGKIALWPLPAETGGNIATPDLEGNLLVWFVALPNPMSGATEAARRLSYPDSYIAARYHKAIPPGAAARLLECGNRQEVAMAEAYDIEFYLAIRKVVADQYAGLTRYRSASA